MGQVINVSGNPDGINTAMIQICTWVQELAQDPSFAAWCSTSHASPGGQGGGKIMGGKNAGKSKEFGGKDAWGGKESWGAKGHEKGYEKGYEKGWDAKGGLNQIPPWEKGKGKGYGKENGKSNGYVGFHTNGHAGSTSDIIIAAAQRLPPDLAHPGAQGPVIALGIPQEMASGLIGKGGQGTKEITN